MSNRRIRVRHTKTSRWGDWHTLWPVCALCAGLLLLFALGIVQVYLTDLPRKSDIPVVVLGHGQDLHLDPTKLRSSELHLFEANASGKKMKFIVERTKDNTIHTALASCQLCYRSHDRHYAKQGRMICGECNGPMDYESKDRQVGTNSCTLVEVPHTETDRDITVFARDVIAQAARQPQ